MKSGIGSCGQRVIFLSDPLEVLGVGQCRSSNDESYKLMTNNYLISEFITVLSFKSDRL